MSLGGFFIVRKIIPVAGCSVTTSTTSDCSWVRKYINMHVLLQFANAIVLGVDFSVSI
jgi:hypothetical protein